MGKRRRIKSLPKKIKIVQLITLLELGGAQGNTIYTADHLDPNIFETHLWAGRGAFWDNEVERKWIHTGRLKFFSRLKRSIHPLFDILVILELARALKELRPDIIHTHSSKAGIVGRIAAKLAGVPQMIHTYHGFGFNKYQKFWTRVLFIGLEKLCAHFSSKLIFVSQANLDEAATLKIGQQEQYVLIRSGIQIRHVVNKAAATDREKGKLSLGLSSGPVISTIGAFKPQKNLLEFVEAAKEILLTVPDAHFLIIGDGVQRGLIDARIAAYKLQDRIILLGWRQDIPALLALTDVFVLTSLWEGLPRALVEAMILGIPSVCYDTDGVHDILGLKGGYIVPHGSWKLAAIKISGILRNKDEFDRLSREAKSVITEEFDIDYMVRKLDELYRGIDKNLRIN